MNKNYCNHSEYTKSMVEYWKTHTQPIVFHNVNNQEYETTTTNNSQTWWLHDTQSVGLQYTDSPIPYYSNIPGQINIVEVPSGMCVINGIFVPIQDIKNCGAIACLWYALLKVELSNQVPYGYNNHLHHIINREDYSNLSDLFTSRYNNNTSIGGFTC